MRPDRDTAIEAQAIDWVVRQRDPGFAEWDAFADWLAADPGHGAAYDAIAGLDADLDALPPTRRSEPSVRRGPSRRAWFGGAVAAALVGAISLSSLGLFDGASRIETAAGEHRTLALADGSRIEVNGASLLILDDDRPRFARLERGEAMFHVVHRADEPFVVEAGGAELVDLGTAFNVVRANGRTAVAVSEGVVAYNPRRENVRVVAGQGLEARDGDRAAPAPHAIDVANVGGWRTGLLVYNDTPLTDVAEDLRRTAGIDLRIAPNAADTRFRGALILAKHPTRTIADLAALSGTRAKRQGDGWVLSR